MKFLKITWGTGTMYTRCTHMVIEDWENEQDAVDKLIDSLEQEHDSSVIKYTDDIELGEDEYLIGGNHGLVLMHYGTFDIEEIIEKEGYEI